MSIVDIAAVIVIVALGIPLLVGAGISLWILASFAGYGLRDWWSKHV